MVPLALVGAASAARQHWKLIVGGLLLMAILVQTVRLERAERRADRLSFELNEAREAIKEAHRESLRLQGEVDRKIEQGRVDQGKADDRAKVIERAPLPGDCKTPREILELEI